MKKNRKYLIIIVSIIFVLLCFGCPQQTTLVLSSNNDLAQLILSNDIALPEFNASNTDYKVSCSNSVSAITVTPTTADKLASIKVRINDGTYTDVVSGNPSLSLNLNVGLNTINIQVTAEDSSIKIYSLSVTRVKSNNAFLSDLTISAGSISPVFVPNTDIYSASVENSVEFISVTPVTMDTNATIKLRMNGGTYRTIFSGTPSVYLNLNVGLNNIEILVTSQDLSTKTYTISLTRAGSSNAMLSGLFVSSGALSPIFSSSINAYSVSVENSVTSMTITPSKLVATATIQTRINGGAYRTVISGNPTVNMNLNVGLNNIEILVIAQDLSTNTYTISVTRDGSNNSFLSGLTISSGTLTPVFSTGIFSYTVSVPNDIKNITITPIKQDINASIEVKINGGTNFAVVSGNPSTNLGLNVGTNTIDIIVTAQNHTSRTYTIIVTKALSSNALLSGLTLSSGVLNPEFNSSTSAYSVSVDYENTNLMIMPTKLDPAASIQVRINGGAYSSIDSENNNNNLALNINSNTIDLLVTAQNGTTKNYTINAIRNKASTDATISSLTIGNGTLSPNFASNILNYYAVVENDITLTTITAFRSENHANMTISLNGGPYISLMSGASYNALGLKVGNNTVKIRVVSQDQTERTYSLMIKRYNKGITNNWTIQNPSPSGNNQKKMSFIDTLTGWCIDADGNLYSTSDGGENWALIKSFGSYIASVQLISQQTGWILQANGTLSRTTNSGLSWTTKYLGTSVNLTSMFFVNELDAWIIGLKGTLLHSSDGGENWNSVATGSSTNFLDIYFINSQIGWIVGGAHTILSTTDGGATWIKQASPNTSSSAYTSIHFSDLNNGWAIEGMCVIKTIDGGKTWTNAISPDPSNSFSDVHFFSPTKGIILASSDYIYRTNDAGLSWSKIRCTPNFFSYTFSAFSFSNEDQGWIVGQNGIILHTVDGCTSWVNQNKGFRSNINSISFVNKNQGWCVGAAGHLFQTQDGGATWQQKPSGAGLLYSVDFINASTGWIGGINGTLKNTTDGGNTWNDKTIPNQSIGSIYSIFFYDDNKGWLCADSKIFRTLDGGQTWLLSKDLGSNIMESVYFETDQIGWAVGNYGTLLRTVDGGINWTSSNISSNPLTSIHACDKDNVWAVGFNGTVLQSRNGGANWKTLTLDINSNFTSIIFVDAQNGCVVDESGDIYTSNDAGISWVLKFSGAQSLNDIEIIDGCAFVGGDSGTILRSAL